MTAEEFLKTNANDISYEEGIMFAADVTPQMLKEFAQIKCKEQREICSQHSQGHIVRHKILNAKEPEM